MEEELIRKFKILENHIMNSLKETKELKEENEGIKSKNKIMKEFLEKDLKWKENLKEKLQGLLNALNFQNKRENEVR